MRGLLRTLVALLALSACGGEAEAPLPVMLPISDFTLTDQRGEDFGTAQLRGHVWVADLIFTSCPEICPVMSSQMANLQRRLPADVRLVSVSVDPAVDTPEVLRAYAERYGADEARWSFLTGAPADVSRVVHLSFRMPIGERMDLPDGRYDILHGGRFLLIDRELNLRGLYATDREGLSALERDVARLRSGG